LELGGLFATVSVFSTASAFAEAGDVDDNFDTSIPNNELLWSTEEPQKQQSTGESVGVSTGLSYGIIGVSKGYSIDPSTGGIVGEQWSGGLSIGPPP
jgi:hypothetical protein